MEIFRKHHAELMTPEWWKSVQENIRAGKPADIFPYPEKIRFRNRYECDGEPARD